MYATLQEAFGINSFVNTDTSHAQNEPAPSSLPGGCITQEPEPLALRGNVGRVAAENDRRVTAQNGRWTVASRSNVVVKAHAHGGAEAAWKALPAGVRGDMMRYAILHDHRHRHVKKNKRKTNDGDIDIAAVAVVGLIIIMLLV